MALRPQVPLYPTALICLLAATLANAFESWMGAALQGGGGGGLFTNDVVNMIQVSVAALLAVVLIPVVHAAPWILLGTLLAAVGWFLRVALGGSVS